jgi:putative inorganic carbon (hco3(-)) transporter
MKGLILAYLITFAGSIAALRYPLIGLHVYVGLAVVRPQFIFSFAGDLSGLSFVVGVAVLIGWSLQGFGDWRFERAWPVMFALLGFMLWFGLAALQALQPQLSVVPVRELSKVTLPFLVGVTLMDGEKDWRPMLWTIVLCQGYVGLEQNINYLLKGYNSAAEGFGGMDNNFFAVSLVTVIGPAIALTISSKTWSARLLAGAAAALILHTLFLTFSRGGMVGLLAVGLVTFVMMPKRPKHIGALLLTILFAVRFIGPELAARYNTAFASAEERDGSAASRVDLWSDTMKVMADHPVFGIGPANWGAIASSYGWTEGKSAHSVWMETAAEAGIPAALLLMLFFGLAVAKLWPIARARQTEANRYEIILASGVILAIVGFSVSGQFVSVPTLEVPYYVTMLGVAMLKHKYREAAAFQPVQNVAVVPSPHMFRPPPRLRPTTEGLRKRG